MRCAQLIYRCASRSAVKRVQRGSILTLQRRTYIVSATSANTARTGLISTTQLFAPRQRWIESRQFSSETTTENITEGASQGQKKRTQRNNNNNYNTDNESIINVFRVNDEAEFDNYQLESKTIEQLIAIMSTLWVKFSNGAKALNIWNDIIYPRTGVHNMSVEQAQELVPVLADLKQYNHAIEIYEHVLRPQLLQQRLRVSQLTSTGPHTYKRGNYSRPAALPSLFHALFTRVAMSEFPTPQQLGDETSGTEHTRTADEVQRDAERLLELWNWVWEEDQATKPTARYLTRDAPARETDKDIAEMPSKQLLNVTRVKEQTTITLSAHKAAKLLSNARALEQIMEYIPQRNWRIVRNTYEILIKEAVTQGKDGALKALEQFQTLCRFGVNSPALCKAVVMALREHNRHHEIVQLAHQIALGELDLAKMVPDRATLNAIIHACYETHQSRTAIDIWNWFVRQYEQRSEGRALSAVPESEASEGGESEVVSDKDKDKEALLKPYFSTIEKYLALISNSNSPVSEAEKLLKTVKMHFAPVSASTYAGMLRIATKANNIEFAIALWTDMKQQAKQQSSVESSAAVQENDQSYNDAVVYASMAQNLLLLLGKQLMPEAWHTRAEMILSELTQLFNTNITHNFVNAFIDQTLRRNYHPETVLDMVTSLIKITGKYPTDVPILRELFDQAAKLGRSELALALFATLKDAQTNSDEENAEAQSEMYSTLLAAYARSGESDKLTRVWALMKQQNIVPTESGFNAVLDGFKEKDVEKAAELIIQAKALPAGIYTATIEALLNENKVDKAAEVFAALYSREPTKLQRVNKNVLRRLSTAITKDKTVALRNSVMPHLRAAISF